MADAGPCGYPGCNDPIETGLRLPWRHTNGLRRNIRPHYAHPIFRSAADVPTRAVALGATSAARRDARLPSEGPEEVTTV
jgi:hypothetical protein